MKYIFSYSLLIMALLLSVVTLSADMTGENFQIRENQFADESNAVSIPSEDDYFFSVIDNPFVSAGLNKISGPRVPVSVVRAENNSCYMLKFHFSRLIHLHLYVVKSTYISYYSKKENDGYYLYALRKLRI